MSPRQVIPIADIGTRLPEHGRIRTGIKAGRAMKAIDTFRFTSQDRQAVEQIAALYGGNVEPWADAPVGQQWQVTTDANEIRVALPPDPLGGTPLYERWNRGGAERRCDGVTCEWFEQGPDGPDLFDGPCKCAAEGVLSCSPITRLSVLITDVRLLGTWRLDTKSMNAAQELPGMVQAVQSMQARGITRAVLRLEKREQKIAGKTNRFVVPVLGLDASVDQLAAGAAAVGSLPAAPADVAELEAGPSPDDEPVDAEVMTERDDLVALYRHKRWSKGEVRDHITDVLGHAVDLDDLADDDVHRLLEALR